MTGEASDVARDHLDAAPSPLETPDQTNRRLITESQQTARLQREAATDYAQRGIPTFKDTTGNIQPVRDGDGAALTHFDKRNNVAYDSTGSPKALRFGETGAPELADPYASAPTTVDPKTGHKYKVAPGLPWKWEGTDPELSAAAAAKERDKAVGGAVQLFGRKLSLEESELTAGERRLKREKEALQQTLPPFSMPEAQAALDAGDVDTALRYADSHFDELYQGGDANKGMFQREFSAEQVARRAQIDTERAAAHARVRDLAGLSSRLGSLRGTVAQQRAMLSGLVDERAQGALGRLGMEMPQGQQPQGQAAPTDAQQVAPVAAQDLMQQAANGAYTPTPENDQKLAAVAQTPEVRNSFLQEIGRGAVRGWAGSMASLGGLMRMVGMEESGAAVSEYWDGVSQENAASTGVAIFDPASPQWWAARLPEVTAGVIPQIAVAIATRGASLPVQLASFGVMGGGIMAGDTYNEAVEDRMQKGESPEQARDGAIGEAAVVGGIGAALESIPGMAFFSKNPVLHGVLGKVIKNKIAQRGVTGFTAEAFTELGQEIVTDFAALGYRDDAARFKDAYDRWAASFLLGGVMGAGVGIALNHGEQSNADQTPPPADGTDGTAGTPQPVAPGQALAAALGARRSDPSIDRAAQQAFSAIANGADDASVAELFTDLGLIRRNTDPLAVAKAFREQSGATVQPAPAGPTDPEQGDEGDGSAPTGEGVPPAGTPPPPSTGQGSPAPAGQQGQPAHTGQPVSEEEGETPREPKQYSKGAQDFTPDVIGAGDRFTGEDGSQMEVTDFDGKTISFTIPGTENSSGTLRFADLKKGMAHGLYVHSKPTRNITPAEPTPVNEQAPTPEPTPAPETNEASVDSVQDLVEPLEQSAAPESTDPDAWHGTSERGARTPEGDYRSPVLANDEAARFIEQAESNGWTVKSRSLFGDDELQVTVTPPAQSESAPAAPASAEEQGVTVSKVDEWNNGSNRSYKIESEGNAGNLTLSRNEDGTWGVEMVTVAQQGKGLGAKAYIDLHAQLQAEGSGLTSGKAGSLSAPAKKLWARLVANGQAEAVDGPDGITYRMRSGEQDTNKSGSAPKNSSVEAEGLTTNDEAVSPVKHAKTEAPKAPTPEPEPPAPEPTGEITEASARATIERALTEIQRERNIDGLVLKYGKTDNRSGLEFNGGKIRVDLKKLAETMRTTGAAQRIQGIAQTPEAAVKSALFEEVVHVGQWHVAGKNLEAFYDAKSDSFFPEGWEEAVRKSRNDYDKMQPWQRKAEFVRMALQKRWTGTISEAFHRLLKDVLGFLDGVAKTASPEFQAHVAEVRKAVEGLTVQKAEQSTTILRAGGFSGRVEDDAEIVARAQEMRATRQEKAQYKYNAMSVEDIRALLAKSETGDMDAASDLIDLDADIRNGATQPISKAAAKSAAQRLLQGKGAALGAEVQKAEAKPAAKVYKIGDTWMSPEGEQEIVGEREVNGELRVMVRLKGSDTVYFHDPSTIERTRNVDEANVKSRKEQDEREAKAAEQAAKAKAEREDLDGFTDGMSPMGRAKVIGTLTDKLFNSDGKPKNRRDIIRDAVKDGHTIRVIEGERVLDKDGVFRAESFLTKTGMDYAAHLIAKQSKPKAQPKAPEGPQPGAEPQSAESRKAARQAKSRAAVGRFDNDALSADAPRSLEEVRAELEKNRQALAKLGTRLAGLNERTSPQTPAQTQRDQIVRRINELSAAVQRLRKGDTLNSDAPSIHKRIPTEHFAVFADLANTMIEDGINTPELLYQDLKESLGERRARSYSRAMWAYLMTADPDLPDVSKAQWEELFAKDSAPSAPTAPEPKAPVQDKNAPSAPDKPSSTAPLTFGQEVQRSVNRVPKEKRYGMRKVWIEDAWNQWKQDTGEEMSLDEFKQELLAGENLGSVELTKNDFWTTDEEAEKRARSQMSNLGDSIHTITATEDADSFHRQAPVEPSPVQDEQSPDAPEDTPVSASRTAADEIAQRLNHGRTITWQGLFEITDKAFQGTQAQGKYNVKDAYDALELGVNLYLSQNKGVYRPQMSTQGATEAVTKLKRLMGFLPTQTKRTSEQDAMQQFSTPPHFSYVANWVANYRTGDVMLEPSDGVGGLSVFAQNAGVKVIANELSPRRRALAAELKPDHLFGENAEQLHAILEPKIKANEIPRPTVVVMNPPFSNAAKSGEKGKTLIGAQHVEEALKLLPEGGRLVAIVGEGMAMDAHHFRPWWAKLMKSHNVRANVHVDGKNYTKYGTTFSNRLLVIDKTGATSDPSAIVGGAVGDILELIPLLEGVRNDRPNSTTQPPTEQGGSRPTGKGGNPKGSDPQPATSVTPNPDTGKADSTRGQGGQPGRADTRTGTTQSESVSEPSGAKPATPRVDGVQQDPAGSRRNSDVVSPVETSGVTVTTKTDSKKVQVENENDVFANYHPSKVSVPGAKPHPADLVESAAMASVPPPDPTYTPNLPKDVIEEGKLSEAQIENIVYAGQAHSQMLESGERRGYFIGDGTGVGKGRQIAGIMLDNIRQGRKRHIWVSKNTDLLKDAQRDAEGVGVDPTSLRPMGKIKKGAPIEGDGVMFTSYDTLKGGNEGILGTLEEWWSKLTGKPKPEGRIEQLAKWLGKDFDGVIAFDEAHMAGNAISIKGKRGTKNASKNGLAVVDLQKALPNARVVYVSATGATEVENLSYADRLGIWGPNTPFPEKRDFFNKISAGGISAMEIVARDLKAMGLYLARSISYKGVGFDRLTQELTPQQREAYDKIAEGWQVALTALNGSMADTGAVNSSDARKNAMSAFWGAQQRFFNQVLTAMEMPALLKDMKTQLEAGHSLVLQLVNTNEASQEREIARRQSETEPGAESSMEDMDLSPRDILLEYIKTSFPTIKYEAVKDPNDPEKVRWVPAKDASGKVIEDPSALAARDGLLDQLSLLEIPENPLEQILNAFGVENVAEITGRGRRVVQQKQEDGKRKTVLENRSVSKRQVEAAEFQAGKRRILLFSQAGGTGFSFHADRTAKNQQKRMHYLVQAGWRADAALQGFGRTHRTNQAHAPHYKLVETNIPGHKRFISTIARRLAQLGALTTGDRNSAGQGMFSESDNMEGQYAEDALKRLIYDLYAKRVEGVEFEEFARQLGFTKIDVDEITGEQVNRNTLIDSSTGSLNDTKMPGVPTFLNRLLAVTLDKQSQYFDLFTARLEARIENAKRDGTYDPGTQLYKADRIEKTSDEVVYTHEGTAAATRIVEVNAFNPVEFVPFEDIGKYGTGEVTKFARNKRSGRVYALRGGINRTLDDGRIVPTYRRIGTRDFDSIPQEDINEEKYETLNKEQAREVWEKEIADAPKETTKKASFLVGAMLPIWDRIQLPNPKIFRFTTTEGESMLGVLIPEKEAFSLRSRMGAKNTMTPESAFKLVLNDGARLTLANGWTIRRAYVSREHRVEVEGLNYAQTGDFTGRMGGLMERIQFRSRYFIPTDEAAGVETIKKVMAQSPVTEVNGSPDALSSDAPVLADLDQSPDPPEVPQTQSAEFQRWFAGSKVVDENGQPLVVYHGVKSPNMSVDRENKRVVFTPKFTEFNAQGRTEPGIWFSPDKSIAAKYGTPVPFYLKAENPIRNESPLSERPSNADGVYRMRAKGDNISKSWEIAVFSPTQIKSAIGNDGTFDADDANMLSSDAPLPALKIEAVIQRLDPRKGLRWFWEGTADVLDRSGFKALSRAVWKQPQEEAKEKADAWKPQRKALAAHAKLSKKDQAEAMKQWSLYFRNQERAAADRRKGRDDKADRRAAVAKGIYETANAETKALIDAWKETAVLTGQRRIDNNVLVKDGEIYRKMKQMGDRYFPKKLNRKTMKVLADKDKYPGEWEVMVQDLIENENIKDPSEADKYLREHVFKKETDWDFYSSIETARKADMPESWMEYSWNEIVPWYVTNYARRMGQIKAYGQTTNEKKDLWEQTLADIPKTESTEYTQAYIMAAAEAAKFTRLRTPFANTLRFLQTFATGALLSSPFSAVRNVVSGMTQTAVIFGPVETLKQSWNALTRAASKVAAQDLGVIHDDLFAMMTDPQDGRGEDTPMRQMLQRIVGKTLRLTGFTLAEEFVRTTAALSAMNFARKAALAITEDAGSAKSAQYMAVIRRMRSDPLKLVAEQHPNFKGQPTETEHFIRQSVIETQGGYTFGQTPLHMSEPTVSFLTQFQKWGTQMARFLAKHAINPMVHGQVETLYELPSGKLSLDPASGGRPVEKKVRSFQPFIYVVAFAILGGEGLYWLKELLTGRKRPDSSFEEVGKADTDTDKMLLLANRLTSDIIMAGTMGMLTDYAANFKEFSTRGRFKNPLDPPGTQFIKNIYKTAVTGWQQGKLTSRDVLAALESQFPGVAFAERFSKTVAGEDTHVARNDQALARDAGMRAAKALGMPIRAPFGGDMPVKSPNTPFYNELQNALLTGNGAEVRALVNERVKGKTMADREKMMKGMRSSVSMGAPLRIGGFASAANRLIFLSWSRKHLPSSDYKRITDLDRRYWQAAQSAGLADGEPTPRQDPDAALFRGFTKR